MHPLVLSLFEQRPDPPLVIDHAAQAPEVRQHRADHAGYGSHSFENDGAVTVALGEKRVGAEAQESREPECKAIREPAWRVMHRRNRIRHSSASCRIGREYRIHHCHNPVSALPRRFL